MNHARAIVLAVPLLAAACGGGGGPDPAGCSLAYSGGASETVSCDTALRTNGQPGGYVLWVMAFRGPPAALDQAGQITLVFDARPVAGVDYGFTAAAPTAGVASGFAERWVASSATHEAYAGAPGAGALTVRFSSLPATDGPDPGGLAGIGTVHGTVAATLVPVSTGTDVAVAGTF
jgi:hypothetical protein